MSTGSISSDKIDLLIYGPVRPILENGFSDHFVVHKAETRADLERLTPAVREKIRGVAVTYHTVKTDAEVMALLPRLEIVASFGVGYDHVDARYASEHGIVVTNTPDVLTEEVADVAMGLLISTVREFVKADRYVRSGLWLTQNYPLSVGSLRDRKVGIVGMGRIGQAIARRLVDDGAARDVDQDAARAERLEHVGIDHLCGRGPTRHDHDQCVDRFRHLDQVGIVLVRHAVRRLARMIDHGNARRLQPASDCLADPAHAHHPDLAIPERADAQGKILRHPEA